MSEKLQQFWKTHKPGEWGIGTQISAISEDRLICKASILLILPDGSMVTVVTAHTVLRLPGGTDFSGNMEELAIERAIDLLPEEAKKRGA